MGLGSYGAGMGPAGEDPLAAASAPRSVTPPAALWFDGATRDFLLDSQGRYLGIHPVDQRAALALLIAYGTISSAPTTGNKVRRIQKIIRSTPDQVRDYVSQCLDSLIRAGDIVVRDVQVETNRLVGSITLAVSYTNLRTSKKAAATIRVNLNAA